MNDLDFSLDLGNISCVDLIVLDFEFKFEDLIHKQPLAHVYLSKDVSTLSNTGCMVFRNTLWTKKFIRRWIENKSKSTCYNEQTGFDELYSSMVNSKEADTLSERVALLPIHVLNSEAPAMWKQQADHKASKSYFYENSQTHSCYRFFILQPRIMPFGNKCLSEAWKSCVPRKMYVISVLSWD